MSRLVQWLYETEGYTSVEPAALYSGDINVVRGVLPACDPSVRSNAPLRHAVAEGRTDIVRLLLSDKRVDPADQGNYAICAAAELGYVEIIRLLLADGRVDTTVYKNSPIREAEARGYTEIAQLLQTYCYLGLEVQRTKGNQSAIKSKCKIKLD